VRSRRRGAAHPRGAGRTRGGCAFRPHHLRTGRPDRRPVRPVDARPVLRVRPGFAARLAWLGEPRSGTLVAAAVPGRPPCVTRSAATTHTASPSPTSATVAAASWQVPVSSTASLVLDLAISCRPGSCPRTAAVRSVQRCTLRCPSFGPDTAAPSTSRIGSSARPQPSHYAPRHLRKIGDRKLAGLASRHAKRLRLVCDQPQVAARVWAGFAYGPQDADQILMAGVAAGSPGRGAAESGRRRRGTMA